MRAADRWAKVEYVTILLGVSGALFTLETISPLKDLGVAGRTLDQLKYALHLSAIRQLHWIYTSKRRLEANPVKQPQHPGRDAAQVARGRIRPRGEEQQSQGKKIKRYKSMERTVGERRKRKCPAENSRQSCKRFKKLPRKRRAVQQLGEHRRRTRGRGAKS